MNGLRLAVAVLGFLMLAGGLLLTARTGPHGLGLVIAGGVILLGTLAERIRYKPVRSGRPGPGWRLGTERFVDPESGRVVAVWYDDRTGERLYADAEQGKP